MAAYSFETMSDSDAAAFGANDYLFFITKGATANQVTVAPYSNGASGSLSGSGITLTYGGKSLTFSTNVSSASTVGHILFNDSSHLVIGTQAGSTSTSGSTVDPTFTHVGSANDPNTIYALGGNDVIDMTSTANGAVAAGAGSSNYLNGGFGADTINGGAGNNHIYGNSMTSQAGDVDPASGVKDGNDTITVTSGSNYINGNAGNDIITVGVSNTAASGATSNASNGTNRVFGGADNDVITILGGGHNSVNGNSGNDVIDASNGSGDNVLRGGQGDDIIRGGIGHSTLMGDVGNDVIFVHGRNGETLPGSGGSSTSVQQHINVITGGAGSDTFDFTGNNGVNAGNNAGAGQAALFGQTVYYQEITDFTIGTDKIHLASNPTAIGQVGHSTTVFASVQDAEVYAQSQLNGSGNQGTTPVVEALAVGSANNTYLFYLESGNVAVTTGEVAGLGIIHLDNVVAANVSYTDFNSSASLGTGTM